MTKEQLDYLVKLYTQHINKKGVDFYVKQDEGYKFDFVNNFQSHFDIESTDFHGMMSKSLLNNNLTSGVYFFPRKMLLHFIEQDENLVKDAIVKLFDTSVDVGVRIDNFIALFDDLMEKENIANKTDNHTFINMRFVSLLLAARCPDNYYLIKLSEYKCVAKFLNDNFFIPQNISVGEKYKLLSDTADDIRGEIRKVPEVISIHNAFINKSNREQSRIMIEDNNYYWTTQDFIFITGGILKDNNEEGYVPKISTNYLG